MERGFYTKQGEEFYRYLDAKIEIQQPAEFDEDGFAIVWARDINSQDVFRRMILDRKGNIAKREPVHKSDIVGIKEGVISYDNGSHSSFVPVGTGLLSLREESIKSAMEEFIKEKLRIIDRDKWTKKDIEELKQYFDHPSTEKLVYEVSESYFEAFQEFRNSDPYFLKRADDVNTEYDKIKRQNEIELEALYLRFEEESKEPGNAQV